MSNKKPESLHTHTTLSDGKLSHREMFELAQSLGVSVVAFTDHDALPNDTALQYLESVRNSPTKWIIGIEITSGLPKELSDASNGGLHIIGLFLDPKNTALLEHCKKAQRARVERMKRMVKNLTDLGFRITEDDCLRASGGDSVGRPQVVEALRSYPENEAVMQALAEEMRKDSEHDPELRLKYDRMMEVGERDFPYTLVLSDGAYRKAYVETSYCPDLDEAVALIRGAGGIASIAHYFTVKNKMPLPFIEKLLREKRIDGMETVYGRKLFDGTRKEEITAEQNELRRYISLHGGLETGGADAHTEEDMRGFARETWFSERTAGFTQKILDSGRVDSRFSSL
ncbi:MAG: PHP domain-containing protein [Parcubacteria group bacterium]|nr:PHP domain-containing protein [Parcubacteria group bacterium]